MKQLDWYDIIPPELLQIAYQSTNEVAWPKEQALQVLDLLNRHGYLILGIDAWRPTRPGPTPFPYDWDIDINPHSTALLKTPKQFIEQFDALYGKGETAVFNFCVRI